MAVKLLIGLGNPELRYDGTRHNAGFAVADAFATRYGGAFSAKKDFKAEVAKVRVDGAGDVLVLKPQTYMNLSGLSVRAVLHYFKIPPEDMLVVYDDVSLPLGIVRFQRAGGAGGHHGIESIIADLSGVKSFDRLKMGVGPDPGGARRADYVLSMFPDSELELCRKVLQLCVEAISMWCSQGTQKAMNLYNGQDLRPPIELESQQNSTLASD